MTRSVMEREREPRRRRDRVALPQRAAEPEHPLLTLQHAVGNRAVAHALMRNKRLRELAPAFDYAYAAAFKLGAIPGAFWNFDRPDRISGEIQSTPVPARQATATPQAYLQTDENGVLTTNRL